MFRYSIVIPFKNSTIGGVCLEVGLSNCSEITAKVPIEMPQKCRFRCIYMYKLYICNIRNKSHNMECFARNISLLQKMNIFIRGLFVM